jgi:hypothetical protein
MTDARQRLSHLIELATTNAPENRRTLAVELCDLLLDWPAHYPAAMREPFEALLEKIVRMIDADTRRALAEKLGAREETPLPLLNEFYFDAPAETRDAIVLRNALLEDGTQPTLPHADEQEIVAAARSKTNGEFARAFASMLGIAAGTAERILQDHSAHALAIVCKGAHMNRATFSALALLTEAANGDADTRERLASFDSVPLPAAERLLDHWRTKHAA